MKTAKELCIENKDKIKQDHETWVNNIVAEVISKIHIGFKGELAAQFTDNLTCSVTRENHGPYGLYSMNKESYYIDSMVPKIVSKSRLLHLLLNNPEAVEKLKELGYKVEFSKRQDFSHFERVTKSVIVPASKNFWGKVTPSYEQITGFENRIVNVELDRVRISACCGEEK